MFLLVKDVNNKLYISLDKCKIKYYSSLTNNEV